MRRKLHAADHAVPFFFPEYNLETVAVQHHVLPVEAPHGNEFAAWRTVNCLGLRVQLHGAQTLLFA